MRQRLRWRQWRLQRRNPRLAGDGERSRLVDARLAPSLEALHRQPESAWTVETMAAIAGMSHARFADHFRTTVGPTPLEPA
jgi:AraC-like DNA-binding protein